MKTIVNYELLDGVIRATIHPKTFLIPTPEEKAAIKPGDHVKLGFVDPTITERMWVKVTGAGVGTLDNDPAFLTSVKFNDVVEFQPQHILTILPSGA